MQDKLELFKSHMSAGHAFFEKGRVDEALAEYRAALECRPDSSAAHCSMGSALTRKKLFQEAIAELNAALRLNPKMAIAYYNLGIALEGSGAFQEAREAYEKFAESAGPEYAKFVQHANSARMRLKKGLASGRTAGSAATPGLSWRQGDVINGIYEVRGILGIGGFGAVNRIYHKGWDTELAVKSPATNILEDKESMYRFFKEANMWVGLGLHPNIVTCYFVRLVGLPRIFMEYVEGGSLSAQTRQGSVLGLDVALDYAVQICRGMEYAHSRGLVHRDLKPGNCLLKSDGTLKITDFGLAKTVYQEEESPAVPVGAGAVAAPGGATQGGLGTPEYMAPEQWTAAGSAGAPADIWAFGVMLYELCCGCKPFIIAEKETLESFYARLVASQWGALAPEQARPGLPAELSSLLKRCLAYYIGQRPSGFAEIRQELEELYPKLFGRPYHRPHVGAAPLLADTLVNQGVSMVDLDRKDEALRLFYEALKIDPTNAAALYNQGLLCIRNKSLEPEKLLEQLAESARLRPWDWLPLYLSGLMAFSRGDAATALKFLNAALMQRHGANLEVLSAVNRLKSKAPAGELSFINVKPRDAQQEKNNEAAFLGIMQEVQSRLNRGDNAAARTLLLKARAVPGYEHYQPVVSLLGEIEAKSVLSGLASFEAAGALNFRSGAVSSIAMLPDASSCLAACADGTLRLCKVVLGETVLTVQAHQGGALCVAYAGPGKALSGGADKTVRLWELGTGRQLFELRGHAGPVNSLCVSSDWRFAATASDDSTVRLWRLDKGSCEITLRGHRAEVSAVAMSPDSKHIISAGRDKTVRVWETATGACLRVLSGHGASIEGLYLLPNGRYCVTSSMDMTLRFWDLYSGQCLRTLPGQAGRVKALAASPDGRFIVAGGVDLRVWDLASGSCLKVVPVPAGGVASLAASPNCKLLISGQVDISGLLLLWNLEWNYNFPAPAKWDQGALPYLEVFLEQRRATAKDGMSRYGAASWTEEDFAGLLRELQLRGYGWLSPEGVFSQLRNMNNRMPRDKKTAERLFLLRLLRDKAPVIMIATAAVLFLGAGSLLYNWYSSGQKIAAQKAEENRLAQERAARQLSERLESNKAIRADIERQRRKEAEEAVLAAQRAVEAKRQQQRRKRAVDYFLEQGKSLSASGKKQQAIAAYKKVNMLYGGENVEALLAEAEAVIGPMPQPAPDKKEVQSSAQDQGLTVMPLKSDTQFPVGGGEPLTKN